MAAIWLLESERCRSTGDVERGVRIDLSAFSSVTESPKETTGSLLPTLTNTTILTLLEAIPRFFASMAEIPLIAEVNRLAMLTWLSLYTSS